MILAALLPTLGFGAAACWFALRTEGTATEARLAGKAATLAALVDRDLAARRAALEVLAAHARDENTAPFVVLLRGEGPDLPEVESLD